jgi:glucose/arabinose dehydrogenase/plastocyanin
MRPRASALHRSLLGAAACIALAGTAFGVTHKVELVGLDFIPQEITVSPGDTIRWVNISGSHTVTSGADCTYDGLYFDDVINGSDPIFEWIVPGDLSGDLDYYCRPHCSFGMTGIIHIETDGIPLQITLDGDQAGTDSDAIGTGAATYFPSSNQFAWEINLGTLEGAESAAHFHGAARQCENAGVQVNLGVGDEKLGSATLTPQQAADVLAGLWYANIHSDLFPGGEIRGQVMPTPLVDPVADIALGDLHVLLEPLTTGLTAPNGGTFAPGDTERLFVTDQSGTLLAIDLASGDASVFLDVSGLLVDLGVFGPDSFDERGFLGVAFHPSYQSNGLLYTYTSEPVNGPADFSTIPLGESANHQAVITEWQVPAPGDPGSVVDPGSARVILRVDEPQFNHDGGDVAFGPDGMLYIALGDGGGADDKDGQDFIGDDLFGHGCGGNGSDPTNPLGSILRIDPLGSDSANGQYGIPGDNPFVGGAELDEIYAYGLRNPFRMSFDMQDGDLYVADVGQNDIEEINIVTAGGNYGWNHKEGSFFFVANGNEPGYVTDMPLDVPAGLVDPVAEYDHDDGTAVIGGYVYRGSLANVLDGLYICGDFAQTFSNDGRLFYMDDTNTLREFQLVGQPALNMSLLGFGQDANGEVYVLANETGTPFGTTGAVLRLRLQPGDLDGDGDVDQADLGILLAAFNSDAGGDLDGDGDTDQADLGILLANFGT